MSELFMDYRNRHDFVLSQVKLDLAGMEQTNFSRNMSFRMGILGISDAEMARRLQRPSVTIGRWRRGLVEPSFRDLERIAMVLEMTVSQLFLSPVDAIKVLSRRNDSDVTDAEYDAAIQVIFDNLRADYEAAMKLVVERFKRGKDPIK